MAIPIRIGFETPGYLWLLALLPILIGWGWRPLAVLGQRRLAAILLRCCVWTAVVAALAGAQIVWVSDRVTVVYVLDQSESIPVARRREMLDYVVSAVRQHRNAARGDRAGVIAFGRDATIEVPPFDDDIPAAARLESLLERTDATNLEGALNLAQASMPDDTARRIVIVTDGNENIGEARRMASRLVASGIGIDVVPIRTASDGEVMVEKIDLPSDIRRGQPFEARVVIDRQRGMNRSGSDPDVDSDTVSGRLRVKQTVDGEESLLLEQTVQLTTGKNVFPLQHKIDRPAAFTYEAEFIPDDAGDDGLAQNNAATGYTYVRGKGRVLLIYPAGQRNDYELLLATLGDADIETVVMASDQLFTSIASLQPYDSVILAGVPRVSGDDVASISSFSDAQVDMLVRNTQQLGAGLIMVGGPEAFGAGGWTGTELEKAMPVDFRIRNSKVQAVGALALIMHASEMPQGNYWQKVIARSAIEQLGGSDYAGLVHWTSSGDRWLWGGQRGLLEVGPNRKAMLASVGRMTPGDMPQFDPAMRMAVAGLARVNASVKHCIIISDGDPSDPSKSVIKAFKDNNITISTVSVQSHGLSDSRRLRSIANQTGGKYYSVKSGKALPKIFQREARRVSRPLVYEPPGGAAPEVVFPHPIVDGIEPVLPPVTGFVLTETKASPLAQVLLQSPTPESPENATILAAWNYGLGRTAALTTDVGARWAQAWASWPGYEKLLSQLVRWSMRPTGNTGQFTLAKRVRDGDVEIVVTALNADDTYLNFLDVAGSVLDPSLSPIPLRMRQTAPGRYSGTFPIDQSGTYFVNVIPGQGNAPLTTGVTVPYSDEFRFRDTNEALLSQLASMQPPGGESGVVTGALSPTSRGEVLAVNSFRGGLPIARRIRDAWPWFALAAAVLFFVDVMVRRIAIGLGWIRRWLGKLWGEPAVATETVVRLDQLRRTKEAAGRRMREQKASTRFESTLPDTTAPKHSEAQQSTAEEPSEQPNPASYTERLLEAKRRAKR